MFQLAPVMILMH